MNEMQTSNTSTYKHRLISTWHK